MVSIETLKFFPLLNRLSEEHLIELAQMSKRISIDTDEWLLEEGDDADWLYLLMEGSISLTLGLPQSDGGMHHQRGEPMNKGELVGWSSVVGAGSYKFGAMANEPSTLIRLDGEVLRQFIVDNPEAGVHILYKIAEVIGERLEFKCTQVLSLDEKMTL